MRKTKEELTEVIESAVAGDKKSLELLIKNMQDMVFNLSLRMLGTFSDAEDATQDIFSSSAKIEFSTFWVRSGISFVFPFSISFP